MIKIMHECQIAVGNNLWIFTSCHRLSYVSSFCSALWLELSTQHIKTIFFVFNFSRHFRRLSPDAARFGKQIHFKFTAFWRLIIMLNLGIVAYWKTSDSNEYRPDEFEISLSIRKRQFNMHWQSLYVSVVVSLFWSMRKLLASSSESNKLVCANYTLEIWITSVQ